jgi:hypothetical protein
MISDIELGYIIGTMVTKVKKIRSEMKVNREDKKDDANKESKAELKKLITQDIYFLRAKIVGDKFEKGKTQYRFDNDDFGAIHKALNELCYNSYKHEHEYINAFVESIKNAKIIVEE